MIAMRLSGMLGVHMISSLRLLVLAALLTVSAFVCSESRRTSELELHRRIWHRAGITDYTLVYEEICMFCGKDIKSYVKNGVVVTLEFVESNVLIYSRSSEGVYVHPDISYMIADLDYQLSISTIDGLFDQIQTDIPWGTERFGVIYNPDLGFPEMFVRGDPDPRVMDGFWGIRVLELSPS